MFCILWCQWQWTDAVELLRQVSCHKIWLNSKERALPRWLFFIATYWLNMTKYQHCFAGSECVDPFSVKAFWCKCPKAWVPAVCNFKLMVKTYLIFKRFYCKTFSCLKQHGTWQGFQATEPFWYIWILKKQLTISRGEIVRRVGFVWFLVGLGFFGFVHQIILTCFTCFSKISAPLCCFRNTPTPGTWCRTCEKDVTLPRFFPYPSKQLLQIVSLIPSAGMCGTKEKNREEMLN